MQMAELYLDEARDGFDRGKTIACGEPEPGPDLDLILIHFIYNL